MQTRKAFLQNSSIALAGLLITKNATASTSEPTFFSTNQLSITTANWSGLKQSGNSINFNTTDTINLQNLICKQTGKGYINHASNEAFQIVKNNKIQIGIIRIENEKELSQKIEVAKKLKQSKNCQFVICISNLGFKNNKQLDDVLLANSSNYIDIIMSTHETNYNKAYYIAQNKNNEEVFIINNKNKNNVTFELNQLHQKQFVHLS